MLSSKRILTDFKWIVPCLVTSLFLDESSHCYKRVCQLSVCPSIRWTFFLSDEMASSRNELVWIGPSLCLSISNALLKFSNDFKFRLQRFPHVMHLWDPLRLIGAVLDASSHLYMRSCPSVGRSVRPSVRPCVTCFFSNAENELFSLWKSLGQSNIDIAECA